MYVYSHTIVNSLSLLFVYCCCLFLYRLSMYVCSHTICNRSGGLLQYSFLVLSSLSLSFLILLLLFVFVLSLFCSN